MTENTLVRVFNTQKQKRAREIVETFQSGKDFVVTGGLQYMGACELPEGFHHIEGYKGAVCEFGTRSMIFGMEAPIKEVLEYTTKYKENVLVLAMGGCIFEVNPDMSFDKVKTLLDEILVKRKCYLDGLDAARYTRIEDAAEKYQSFSITDVPLWNKYEEENLNTPKSKLIPPSATRDARREMARLVLYGMILEGLREKDGVITPSAIEYADDIAGLSIDLKKICRGDLPEGCRNVRFEGERFWADIILSRTWKYGDELLRAEGFPDEDIKKIKTHPILPTKYTYWVEVAYPRAHDVRVKEFWYGENPEKFDRNGKILPFVNMCHQKAKYDKRILPIIELFQHQNG